jgi:hypothetical protein
MGNDPNTFATPQSYQGYYWSAYKQTQDKSHSKYRSTDGTGFTIRGMAASDGFSSAQRRPYSHWGTGYPNHITWKCGAHGYVERFATLGAVNGTLDQVPRVKSTDDTLNAWGLRNMYCEWSFGFICLAKSGCLLPFRMAFVVACGSDVM